MNWKNGYTARFYYTEVDPASWRDLRSYELIGGSILKTISDKMESADLALADSPSEHEMWIRVWLEARSDREGAREALFTGLLSVPQIDWDGRRNSRKAECCSVLQPAADRLLPRGWYASQGISAASIAAGLLSVGPAPIVFAENAPTLSEPIIAAEGETNLSMARKVIEAIGWRIRINGQGRVFLESVSDEERGALDSLQNDCVEMQISEKHEWFYCPNVFRAISENLTAEARDEDPASAYSVVSRGREIWKEESGVILKEGESLAEYAARRLKEEQNPVKTISYTRRFVPDLYPGDVVRLHYPAQRIEGKYRIRTQRIDLGFGARTQEEVAQV